MKKTTKIWYGVGACATLAAAGSMVEQTHLIAELPLIASASAANTGASAKGTFVGNLDLALENIFAGEGGEGGEGLTPMWPTVTAPALTGPEVAKVLTGNTLQLPGHASYHFTGANTVEGLYIDWQQQASASVCPPQNVEGSDYYLNPKDNVCWKQRILPATGKWSIRNHQLCLDVSWSGGGKQGCRYVTILLDNIALFDASGAIDGKGHKLLKGKQLEQQ